MEALQIDKPMEHRQKIIGNQKTLLNSKLEAMYIILGSKMSIGYTVFELNIYGNRTPQNTGVHAQEIFDQER